VNDEPLVPGPLYGLRTWTVVSADGCERLAGLHHGGEWPIGGAWLDAACATAGEHPSPAPDCGCGIHAWHPTASSARRVMASRRELAGVVEARGAVEVHEEGFRAERARPHALVVSRDRNGRLVRRLAENYGTEVIEARRPGDLLAWCRERGLGLDEHVVAELLGGPGWVASRRRWRRTRRRNNALRVGAAVVLATVSVGLGAHFAVDAPGPKTLYGRTGWVHVR
jgi:hypothetical protein